MKLQKYRNLIIAIVAGLLLLLANSFGLNLPERVVTDVVEDRVDALLSENPESFSQLAVREVIDGDTIVVSYEGKDITVRVLGIDTPEVQNSPQGLECYGNEASLRAKELLGGAVVDLETDNTQATYDVYDRLLAYVSVDNMDYGEQMIREGYAREYTYKVPYQRQSDYRSTEAAAKENFIGLWGECN